MLVSHAAKDKRTASEAWKKSLRVPDSKEFCEFKQDHDWNRLQEEWKITLTSYGLVSHLIDPTFVTTDAETDCLQQNWLIWDEVDRRNGSSMATELFLSQLMSYLTSTKLKGSIWDKSNKFLRHYDESLCKWDEQSGEPLSERMKTRYLSQSVIGVPDLDKVLTTHLSAMKAAGKTDYIRYDEYLRLLIKQADIYDGANTVGVNNTKRRY